MPFGICQPFRTHYFKGVFCPDDVKIPVGDIDAWRLNPKYNYVYDKLFVAMSQGLAAAPHGVVPETFPVFSKPAMNLMSMGVGSMVVPDADTYEKIRQPGHFWSTLLSGRHMSTDVAVVNGEVKWWGHATCVPGLGGTFDYFKVEVGNNPSIEEWCGPWVQNHLSGYTGMANMETIGNRIIEVHLRFTDQWIDLYPPRWLDAVVHLYVNKVWLYDQIQQDEGFSVILFGTHDAKYRCPSQSTLEAVHKIKGVMSVQVAFDKDTDYKLQAHPPGGRRLAIINAKTLEAGKSVRNLLKRDMEHAHSESG